MPLFEKQKNTINRFAPGTASAFSAIKHDSKGGFNKKYFLAGICILALYLVHLIFGIQWTWLTALQHNAVYKQGTGFLLFSVVAYQYWLAFSRHRVSAAVKKRRIQAHKWFGVVIMLLLFIHSVSLGHAYQSLLLIIFVSNCVVGLFNIETMKLNRSSYFVWVVIHVTLANVTIAMALYHIYITYQFS